MWQRGPILWSASSRDIREARAMNGISRAPIIRKDIGLTVMKPAPFARIFRFASKRHEANDGKVRYNLLVQPHGFQDVMPALEASRSALESVGLLYSRENRKRLPQQTREDESMR